MERYCFCRNFLSRASSWDVVKGVRGFLFVLCFRSGQAGGLNLPVKLQNKVQNNVPKRTNAKINVFEPAFGFLCYTCWHWTQNLRGGVGENRELCIHEVLSLLSGLSGLINISSGMFMMSPTENGELMAKPGTEVSRAPNAPILAPLPVTCDVPGTDVAPGDDGTSLLGFLSAISASTLKGKIATLDFPVSSAGLKLVCMSPLLTRTEREGRSSVFKPAIKADIAIDGAIQVRLARRDCTWLSRVQWKSYTKFTQGSLWSPYPHVYVTKL